jgi:hypothetical protein
MGMSWGEGLIAYVRKICARLKRTDVTLMGGRLEKGEEGLRRGKREGWLTVNCGEGEARREEE